MTATKQTAIGWEQVGVFGVDSGCCWIGDPSYLIGDTSEIETWDEFCKRTAECGHPDTMQWLFRQGHPGLGVSFSTGGDGQWPVFARRDEFGQVVEIRIPLMEEN